MNSPHSPDVAVWLDCGKHGRIPLSRVTPKSVEAKEPQNIPPCTATLVAIIDGRESSARVVLPIGFGGTRTAIIE